jgi:hypothetical protein
VHCIPLEQPLLDGGHQPRVAHKLLQAEIQRIRSMPDACVSYSCGITCGYDTSPGLPTISYKQRYKVLSLRTSADTCVSYQLWHSMRVPGRPGRRASLQAAASAAAKRCCG